MFTILNATKEKKHVVLMTLRDRMFTISPQRKEGEQTSRVLVHATSPAWFCVAISFEIEPLFLGRSSLRSGMLTRDMKHQGALRGQETFHLAGKRLKLKSEQLTGFRKSLKLIIFTRFLPLQTAASI